MSKPFNFPVEQFKHPMCPFCRETNTELIGRWSNYDLTLSLGMFCPDCNTPHAWVVIPDRETFLEDQRLEMEADLEAKLHD